MHKVIFCLVMIIGCLGCEKVSAHCQMPCGIYNDQMIYDKIDQYYDTMIKGMHVINNNKFENVHDRNEFVRWVMTKDKESDEVANVLLTYFLMQKIKPSNDPDSLELLKSIHNMLFLLVQIKQGTEIKMVREFGMEWDHFKELFHPEKPCSRVVKPEHSKKPVSINENKPADKSHTHTHTHGEGEHTHTHDEHDHDHEHPHTH